jgi:uncharacterized membrane protein
MTNVEESLKNLQIGHGYEELTLEEFRDFYHKIINRKILKDHTVFAIFIEDRIFIRFPEKPKVRFVIRKEKGFFNEKDLNFVPNLEPMGTYKGEYRFSAFIIDEFKLNGWKLMFIFFSTFTLFSVTNNVNMLQKVNEMILTSVTIFISIFLLFVVSQKGHKNEFKLMKDETLYKFFQNDKYIGILAIFLVLLSILTVAISYIDLNWINLPLSFLTSFSLVILVICYLAIYQYYFERMKLIRILPTSEELFNDRLQKYKDLKSESK